MIWLPELNGRDSPTQTKQIQSYHNHFLLRKHSKYLSTCLQLEIILLTPCSASVHFARYMQFQYFILAVLLCSRKGGQNSSQVLGIFVVHFLYQKKTPKPGMSFNWVTYNLYGFTLLQTYSALKYIIPIPDCSLYKNHKGTE